VGLRKLLTRQPADPLKRLAELGREIATPTPTREKAQPTREAIAAPTHAARLAPKAIPLSTAAREERDVPDARNFAVWKRQQSPGIVGLFDRKF
jgi:hypothetical protein